MQGTSLEVQWLRVRTFNAGGTGIIPDQGRSHMPRCMAKKKVHVLLCSQQQYSQQLNHTTILLSHKKEHNAICINMMQLEVTILVN